MIIIPMLALAGSLGRKTQVPPSLGTFPVTTPLFATLLVGAIVIVGVLTFFPVLSLGPVVEHFLTGRGDHVLIGEAAWQRTRKLSIWIPYTAAAGCDGRVTQTRPEVDGLKSGDVRRGSGRGADYSPLLRYFLAGGRGVGFELQITLWLWITVLFANLAEAMAEGRGKAQADTLRKTRTETVANRVVNGGNGNRGGCFAAEERRRHRARRRVHPVGRRDHRGRRIRGRVGNHRRVRSGHSRSGWRSPAVTGGTRVLSDWIKVRVTSDPGHTFLDRTIGARRRCGTAENA